MSENDAKRMSLDSDQDTEGHRLAAEPAPDSQVRRDPEPDGARHMIDGDEDVEAHQVRMDPEPDGARHMIDGEDESYRRI